jgi:predicted AAA+ superfamily ATPase
MAKYHTMKRDIYAKLREWKSSSRRKPLLLQGARQTGKTHILKEFGRNEYENTVYCNFEEDSDLSSFFQHNLNPDRILAELSIYMNAEFKPGRDLVIFDEIQVSNRALNALKYFDLQFNSTLLVRANLLNLRKDGKIYNLPLYAVSLLSDLVSVS